jgi:glycosyltransferase involved in cell wall biosynthesis
MKKKILFIHHGWGIGGAPLSLLYLVKNLNPAIYDPVVLFTHKSEALELFRKEGLQTVVETRHNRYFRHHAKGRLKYYQVYKAIRILIDWFLIAHKIAPETYRTIRPDIIHLNSDVLSSWAFGATETDIPVVCHNRDPISNGLFGVRKFVLKRILARSVAKVISISVDNRDRLGLPKITEVIYNPVPNEFFQEYDPTIKESKRILFVGGVHRSKGLDLLLKAVEYIDPAIRIILAGSYPKPTWLNKLKHPRFFRMIEQNETRLSVKGVLTMTGIISELRKASFLVFPAVHSHFARPIIESYATQTSVIASDLSGMDEIVENDVTGYLVKIEPKALAEKINSAVLNVAKRKAMGEVGFRFAQQTFGVTSCVGKTQKLYTELLC